MRIVCIVLVQNYETLAEWKRKNDKIFYFLLKILHCWPQFLTCYCVKNLQGKENLRKYLN